LAKLPEDQRAVLLLVAVEDLSYSRLRSAQYSIGTVMSRLSRAREKLQQEIEVRAEMTLGHVDELQSRNQHPSVRERST